MSARQSPDQLLRGYFAERPMLEAFLMAAARDWHLAQDVLQEVAIVLVRKADTYDDSRPLGSWLRGIARRELASRLAGRKERTALMDPDTLEAVAPAFEESCRSEEHEARRKALAECVGLIDGAGKKVLDLRYRDLRGCAEIAAALGRSVQAVYSILKRVKESLKRCVEARIREVRE